MPVPDARPEPAGSELGRPDLSATHIVRFTRRTSRRYNRARSSGRDLFVDLYSNVLAVVCAAMIAGSLVIALREEIVDRGSLDGGLVDDRWQVLPAGMLWVLLTYLALVGIHVLARRLGPVTVSRAEAAWWLPLPVDRRAMVLPSFLRRALGLGVGAGIAFVPFSILTATDNSVAAHLSSAAGFGAASVIALAAAAFQQVDHTSARRSRAAALLTFVPLALLTSFPAPGAPQPAMLLIPVLLPMIVAVLLVARVMGRIGRIPGVELARGGAVSGHVGAALFFLDANELQRALAREPVRGRNQRAGRFYARPTRSAFAGLVRADVVAFVRLRSAPVAPLIWLGVCLGVVLADDALPALLQLAVIVLAGCATAAGSGTVVRRTAMIPELDALLPLSSSLVTTSRLLMPTLASALWMTALTGILGALGPAGEQLMILGFLAGIGMGAGTVRAGTRPATDWTTPPVETPFGPVPRDQISSLLRGTDVTILAMLPTLLTLYLGAVHPWLILVQGIVSLVSVLVVVAGSPMGSSVSQARS